MSKKSKNSLLNAALEYHRRGWCIIPIGADKKPPKGFKWKKYQSERPSESQIRKWFGSGKYTSLAVVCGAVSGGLAVLDFDSEQRCQWWRTTQPNLAKTLPTAQTKKGLHVYFRSKPFPKRNGNAVDLLCDGAYAILPPSPDKEWLTPLNGELSLLDPFEWGLEQFGIQRPLAFLKQEKIQHVTERADENTGELRRNKEIEFVLVNEKIDAVISKTLPKAFHTRHNSVFGFARGLKSMPEYTDADPIGFYNVVKEWHKRALPNINTKEFEETWIDFLKAWPKIKYKIGESPMTELFERAIQSEPPKIAVAKYPNHSKLKILVSLCKELQREAGESPFFLAVRTASRLLNISAMQASRWLFLLENDDILKVVAKGGTAENPRKATRFRYIAN